MLTVYTLENSAEWDNVIKSFAEYDTYWFSGYVNSFKIHGDGEPLLFYYDDGEVKGINVVMKRDISKCKHFEEHLPENTFFDFATPYGYGGWLIEGKETGNLFKSYEEWCKKNNIVSEFVRFHPLIKNHSKTEEAYDIIALGPVVAIDLSSPEVIWQNFTSANRNKIRKAEKNGVSIHIGKDMELFHAFREVYNETMEKNNADEYYFFSEEFYESILNGLYENFEIFYAMYEGKIVAASIMLMINGKMNYHLSGSLREYIKLAPTNLLLYKAAEWGSERGYKTLYLGGGVGSGEDSLLEFKRSFYRVEDLPIFHIGKKIFNKERYDELVSLRKDLSESGFFPKYRA